VGIVLQGGTGDGEEDDETADDDSSFACLWRLCGMTSPSSAEMVRHVHFHAFHTKIKCHGEAVVRSADIRCQLDETQRNILPDLSEPLLCLWRNCDESDAGEKEFPEAVR
jgi:hypothetical protein